MEEPRRPEENNGQQVLPLAVARFFVGSILTNVGLAIPRSGPLYEGSKSLVGGTPF